MLRFRNRRVYSNFQEWLKEEGISIQLGYIFDLNNIVPKIWINIMACSTTKHIDNYD